MNKLFHFIYVFNKMGKNGEKELIMTTAVKSLDNTLNISKENKKTVDKTAKSNYICFYDLNNFCLISFNNKFEYFIIKKTKKNVN